MQTEDYCPGTTDFKVIRVKAGAFSEVEEEIEIIGFINCGGCPGKKALLRARELVKRGRRYHCFRFLYTERSTDGLSLSLCKKDERHYLCRVR